MQHLLLFLILGCTHVGTVFAQSLGFTVFPQQVVTGLTYTVAWNSNGQPATIELLRSGVRQDRLFTSDGTTNSFQWSVKDDYTGATNYALQISSGSATSTTNSIYVIEDEDGLIVSGSRITAPSPTPSVNLASVTGVSSQAPATTSAQTTFVSLMSTSTLASPTSSLSPTDPNIQVNTSRGLGGAAIAGIIIGVIGAAIVASAGVWLCMRRRAAAAAAAANSSSVSDPVDSFLALGRHGRTSRTIKGTSPNVSNYPSDKHELTGGGTIETPELYGELFAPWNASGRGRFYSDATVVQEPTSKKSQDTRYGSTQQSSVLAPETVRYELPADSVHRN